MRSLALSYHLQRCVFAKAACREVFDALLQLLRFPGASTGVEETATVEHWDEFVRAVRPLRTHPSRYFVGSLGAHAVVVSNYDGSGPVEVAPSLSRELGTMVAYAAAAPDDRKWIVYDRGKRTRGINCQEDTDGWVFAEVGAPQSYEDKSRYKKRLRKERLTPPTVLRYAQELLGETELPSLREVYGRRSYGIYLRASTSSQVVPTVVDLV